MFCGILFYGAPWRRISQPQQISIILQFKDSYFYNNVASFLLLNNIILGKKILWKWTEKTHQRIIECHVANKGYRVTNWVHKFLLFLKFIMFCFFFVAILISKKYHKRTIAYMCHLSQYGHFPQKPYKNMIW